MALVICIVIWGSLGHEMDLFSGPDHHSMIAVTACSKMANHHSMTAVTAKSAVTARIREMMYAYIARPEAVTGPLLGDLQMLSLTGGSPCPGV